MGRRDQFHLVTQRHELAAPVMRRTASLHRHHAGREPAEKLQDRPAPKLANDDDLALRADAVNLKNSLRQIEPDPRDSRQILGRLRHGRLLSRCCFDNTLARLMPLGRRPPHSASTLSEPQKTGRMNGR
jgi:hypothetical protein